MTKHIVIVSCPVKQYMTVQTMQISSPVFWMMLEPFVDHTSVEQNCQYRASSTNTSVSGDLNGYNDSACTRQ